MNRSDYKRLAEAFHTIGDLMSKMADEATPLNEQVYMSRPAAAKLMGCSVETVRQRILDGSLTEYTAGLKVEEVLAYASGISAPAKKAPAQEYRVQSPRQAARRMAHV